MVQRVSRTTLLKSCFIVFAPQLAILFFLPSEFMINYRFLIIAINMAVSGALGWKLYKHYYHLVFSYDDEKFSLVKGSVEKRSYNWAEFEKLSVATSDYGEFKIRLYEKGGGIVEIPVEKLKIDPFEFRPVVMRLLKAGVS